MKKHLLFVFSTFILLMPSLLLAAVYPGKAIRIISPFAAGDAIDNTARVMAERLKSILKTPVVVQNIAGGGGAVGLAEAAKAEADGYTLAIASTGALTAGPLVNKGGFEPDDFAPLARLVTMPLAVAVGEKSPYKSLQDIVTAAKAKELSYSTPGPSSKQRIVMTQFAKKNGMKLVHVAGKGGMDAATKAMTGEVDFVFTALPVFENLARSGKLKIIAVSAEKRADYMPDVPTFKESGYSAPGELWFGLVLRKEVPAQIRNILDKAIREAASQEETKQIYAKLRFTDGYLDQDAFKKVIDDNIADHKTVLKELGLIK
ncbi:MAG: tripartite tricarboxylate transporter substrate binding protein [Desulfovibrio sp.]|jgi:tripartite-type tricarboxylate transporter receptor subunit TctC|nr:tripartite tricarboxylate transporter substrate binding protein [Desulfovibrio sp.]